MTGHGTHPGYSAQAPLPAVAVPRVRVGALVASLYAFVLASRISEILSLHVIRLPAILLLVSLVFAGISALGGTRFPRIASMYAGLTAIFIVSAILGVWPGGSLQHIIDVWFRSVALFFALVYTVVTVRDLRTAIRALAYGTAVLGLYTMVAGEGYKDRLGGGTSYGDPNFIALSMLFAIPMFIALIRTDRNVFLRIAHSGAVLLLLAVMAQTGSRGGMVGAAAMLVVLFFSLSAAKRVMLIAGMAVGLAVAVAVLPSAIITRYTTMTEAGGDNDTVAAESASARRYLFWQSVYMSIRHPVLGVGTGMFAVAENEAAKGAGARRGAWHETHNMYTQVSSEAGTIALGLFIAIIVMSYRHLGAVYRLRFATGQPEAQAAQYAFWLRLSLTGVVVAGLFLSIAYGPYVPVLAALGAALHRQVSVLSGTQSRPAGTANVIYAGRNGVRATH